MLHFNGVRLSVALLIAALALAAGGCGGSEAPAQTTAAPAAVSPAGKGIAVAVQLFQFKPSPVNVPVGTRVTWTNGDDILHTVTSGTPDTRSSVFDLPMQGKGVSVAFTFDQSGTYSYFCSRHESMRGEIRVQ